MYPLKTTIALLVALLILSCGENKSSQSRKVEREVIPQKLKIIVQPFTGLPSETTNYIVADLRKIFANIEVRKPIELPKSTLNEPKTRHRAELILNYLKKYTGKDEIIIGLTHQDISTTKGAYKDWGVMGLSYCPGHTCIASTFRLKGHNKLEKFSKVAIHELGHTQGLPHCADRNCLMRDALGKDRFDEVSEFCSDCETFLQKKGWEVKKKD